MKVYLGPYKSWFGPYQLAEKIMFWRDKDDDSVFLLGRFLATGTFAEGSDNKTWLHRLLQRVDDTKTRKINVHIDRYDAWSLDHTLALIICPALKELKRQHHGAPQVDVEDVPEELRPTPEELAAYNDNGATDSKFFKRWDWVLDEMIYAFEQHSQDDWTEKFYTKLAEGGYSRDAEGFEKENERIANGRRLFAKYYENLWD